MIVLSTTRCAADLGADFSSSVQRHEQHPSAVNSEPERTDTPTRTQPAVFSWLSCGLNNCPTERHTERKKTTSVAVRLHGDGPDSGDRVPRVTESAWRRVVGVLAHSASP